MVAFGVGSEMVFRRPVDNSSLASTCGRKDVEGTPRYSVRASRVDPCPRMDGIVGSGSCRCNDVIAEEFVQSGRTI